MENLLHTAHLREGEELHTFAFYGTARAYFRIWLVNIALTLLTLGIYSAWAKVRTRRYFCGSTALANATFDFHASPWSILTARLCVALALLAGAWWAGDDVFRSVTHSLLLAIFVPWALARGLAFNARYSSYRNVRFGFEKSSASYLEIYAVHAPFIALVLMEYLHVQGFRLFDMSGAGLNDAEQITLEVGVFVALILLMAPWMLRGYHRFKGRRHRWGRTRMGFAPRSGLRYMAVFWGMPLAALAAAGSVLFLGVAVAGVAESRDMPSGALTAAAFAISYVALCAMLCIMLALLFKMFWDGLQLANGGRVLCGFSVWRFGMRVLLLNYAAIVLSLGLLYAWARIRKTRFLAANMALALPAGELERALTDNAAREGALGQEFDTMDGFDFDVGLL